jgi:hypothetical protein
MGTEAAATSQGGWMNRRQGLADADAQSAQAMIEQ